MVADFVMDFFFKPTNNPKVNKTTFHLVVLKLQCSFSSLI